MATSRKHDAQPIWPTLRIDEIAFDRAWNLITFSFIVSFPKISYYHFEFILCECCKISALVEQKISLAAVVAL